MHTSIQLIGILAIIWVIGLFYKAIGGYRFFLVPRSLRHLPRVTAWQAFSNKAKGIRHYEFLAQRPDIASNNSAWLCFNRGLWFVMLNHPSYVKPILLDSKTFPKLSLFEAKVDRRNLPLVFKFFGPHNIVTSNGDEWWKRRKLAYPIFNSPQAWDGTNIFGRLTNKLFEHQFKTPLVRNLNHILSMLTFDVLGEVSMGYEFHTIDDPKSEWLKTFNKAIVSISTHAPLELTFPLLAALLPVKQNADAVNQMRALAAKQLADRKGLVSSGKVNAETKRNVLDMLIEANQSEKSTLTDEEVIDDLIVYFFAGHDTTSASLAGALYYLALHPDVRQKARKEIRDTAPHLVDKGIPTMDEIQKMTYLDMVVRETLRIHSPADPLTERIAAKDVFLEGATAPSFDPNGIPTSPGPLLIPKGVGVNVSNHQYQHNKALWGEDADEFRPERWTDIAASKVNYGWIPFGQGPRICLGYKMSLVEQKVFLSMLLARYDWWLPKDSIHKDSLQLYKGAGSGLAGQIADLDIEFMEL